MWGFVAASVIVDTTFSSTSKSFMKEKVCEYFTLLLT